MEFLEFFSAPNLAVADMARSRPWDFSPANLADARAKKKPARRAWALNPATAWNVYSAVRPVVSGRRLTAENPAAGLRGLVADYDAQQPVQTVVDLLAQMKQQAFVPNFIEISLGLKIRLVWVFERELLVNGNAACQQVIEKFFEKIGVPSLLAGFDTASSKPAQMWTNGGEWFEVNPTPVPWESVFGTAVDAQKASDASKLEIPLATVADEAQKRWPGRWQGEFALDALGVRFWDETADNSNGCQIKPDGMLCFTGPVPFMRWEQIFGAQWVNEKRSLNLGQAAADIYFDGHSYWQFQSDTWFPSSREDLLLKLRLRGIASRAGKGQVASDADKVIGWIQETNRVHGTAPLINFRPGLVQHDGQRILNTSTVVALQPVSSPATPEQFPWLWHFIHGLFGDELATHSFLAWLKRFYASQLNYEQDMGQAVFICGPKSNGKTLLCMKVVKPLVGDKAANPYDLFTGKTDFNAELFAAPLLAINDEEATENEREKRRFLSSIKSFVVNPQHAYHKKYADRVNVPWTGRILVTLNDDSSSNGLLPEVNENTQDKLMFFASKPYTKGWADRKVTESTLRSELPFFARWLLDWPIPENVWEGGRMGVRSYFDERILELSSQQLNAYNLVELLRLWIELSDYWSDPKTETWEGTPTSLHTQFEVVSAFSSLVREWPVRRIRASLNDLCKQSGIGIALVPGRAMHFRLTRSELMKT